MKFLRWMLILGLLFTGLLVAVVALFPARTALDWLGPRLGAIQLKDVGGTVWNGHAAELSVHGTPLGRFAWTIAPFSLLSGVADTELRLEGERYKGQGKARIRGPLSADFSDFELEFPAERLNPALDIPGLIPVGRVQVKLKDAVVDGGYPSRLNGEAVWRDAAVAGEASASFGDLRAEFATTQPGQITGLLNDLGGNLSLEGSFNASIAGYEAEAILAARDGNPQVIKALGWIGEAQPDGSSLLKVTGRWLPLQ